MEPRLNLLGNTVMTKFVKYLVSAGKVVTDPPAAGRRGHGACCCGWGGVAAIRAWLPACAQVGNDMAGGDVIAYGDPDGGDGSGHGRRDVQRGLVRLQGDQRVLAADHVTGGHMYLDHWHVDEMADIGDCDLDDLVNRR